SDALLFWRDLDESQTFVVALGAGWPLPRAGRSRRKGGKLQSVSESVPASARTEIVFVDAGVEGYEAIIAGVAAGAEVVLIDSSADGLAQMVEALKGREAIDAIHVVSHGDAGRLLLGAATLSAGNLDFYA